jgi:ribosomal protein S18 acetylase RimI-like enzyme
VTAEKREPVYRESAIDEPAAHRLLTDYFESRELGFVGGNYRTVFPSADTFTAPNGVFLVVEWEGADVGCGAIRTLAPGRMEIKHLWLEPQARGNGFGRALLTELERRAAEHGATEVVLDTNASLEAAGNLYRSAGYVGIEPYNDNPNATNWYLKALG